MGREIDGNPFMVHPCLFLQYDSMNHSYSLTMNDHEKKSVYKNTAFITHTFVKKGHTTLLIPDSRRI